MLKFAQDVNFLSYFFLLLRILEKILCGQKAACNMEKCKKERAKEALIEYFKLSHRLIEISEELGSESGIHRLFGLDRARIPCKNTVANKLQLINFQEWKARRNLKD